MAFVLQYQKERLLPMKVVLHQLVLLSGVGSLGEEIKSKSISVRLYSKSLEVNEKDSFSLFG